MLLGAFRATRQTDLKLLLAYGTVSQLGFLTLLLAYGSPGATLAGLTLVLAHALFKSSLFLTVGTIDHAMGTRDIRRLVGVRQKMPLLALSATLAAMSMAGLPVLLGFVGKEAFRGPFGGRPAHGLQELRLGETLLFVLPSTSPANAGVPWDERLRWFRALHDLVEGRS